MVVVGVGVVVKLYFRDNFYLGVLAGMVLATADGYGC